MEASGRLQRHGGRHAAIQSRPTFNGRAVMDNRGLGLYPAIRSKGSRYYQYTFNRVYKHQNNLQVVLSGSNVKSRLFELYIEDSPLLIPGAPVFRRLLEEFEGPMFEGYTIGLSQEELLRLNVNIVHMDLWDPKLGQSILKTEWKYVSYFVE